MSGRGILSACALMVVSAVSASGVSAVTFVHKRTGIRFPADSGAVSIDKVSPLSSDDRDVAVTYKSSPSKCCLTITVFLYAKVPPASRPDETLADHAAEVRKGITSNYPGARCKDWNPVGVESNGTTSREECSFDADVGGKEQPAISFTIVRNIDGFWLKFRATTKVSDRAALESVLLKLERALR